MRHATLRPRVTLPCPVWPECRFRHLCTDEQCHGWPLKTGVSPPVLDLEQKICTYCGQVGHRAHACPRRKADHLG